MTQDQFLGIWHLIPELCFYQAGQAPEEGTYVIRREGDSIAFTINWTSEGTPQSVSFEGPLDGVLHPSDVAPGALVSYTRVDARTLESAFEIGGTQMAFARRQVSEDGALMAVLQLNRTPDGKDVRITQVYRRAS